MKRHLIIPDAQLKPGGRTEHVDWAAKAIVRYKPDVVVVLGDWWDMHSLSSHEKPGSVHMEGSRIRDDIDVGNEAFRRLVAPMNKEIARRRRRKIKRWNPECHFLFGNHEHRITRVVCEDPKLQQMLSLDMLETPGFERHDFLRIVPLDGIKYCHYFPNPLSGKPIGGTVVNRLNHIGSSFVQGHQQGYLYASKQYPDCTKHGLVCGRFYLDEEHYRPVDVQRTEWNGIVILNEVKDGAYDIMPLSMRYLQAEFA